MRLAIPFCALVLAAGVTDAPGADDPKTAPFASGGVWLDTGGHPIQAHGGGVLYDHGVYYWYGENKDAPNATSQNALLTRVDVIGISCYSSTDLVHWKNEGVVLPAVGNDPGHDLSPGAVVERPKVVFNRKTKQYVMWMHVDRADYKKAKAGVAVSSAPTGPFRYLGSVRPDGFESRDLTLFLDDDGKAYLVYASDWNATMRISRLSDDYLKTVGDVTSVFEGRYREAPALLKRQGLYYLVTSGCTGWYPNRALYATAPRITGPWTVRGSPGAGPDAEWTFFGQSTFALPVAGRKDAFVLMLDRWKSRDLRDSRYLWLPVRFEGDRMLVDWWDEWDPSVFDRKERTSPATARFLPLSLRDEETIVFYGDSITEQNLYSEYLENFLLTRFPGRKIACFNFGWGGDTALGGGARYARDVAGVKPSLVFVNFGMNDGGYKAYQETIYRGYIGAQADLAEKIAAAGAREVLFTTSPVDDVLRHDGEVYNDTLARMADGVIALARGRGLPVIDLLHPMVEVQRLAREKEAPGFTMIPDTVHPDPVGHLVMAYLAMRQIDAPRTVGEIEVRDETVGVTGGATVANVQAQDGGITFDLTLPFLPFYVPKEARKALELVPLEEDLNRFRLRADAREPLVLAVDGQTAATLEPDALARGVDLALLDDTPWARAGALLWRASQHRWTQHQESWRRMELDRPAYMMPDLPSFEPHARAQRAYSDELGRSLGRLARPGIYHVSLVRGLKITSVEISPTYPLKEFSTPWPPETEPDLVAWTKAPFTNGQIDLGTCYHESTQVVAYVRVVLEAEEAGTLHLALGSDDGLAVFADGRQVFAHDVLRSLKPGEDEAEVPLRAGRNEIVFKVTQAGGDFGLAVEAQLRGRGRVRVVSP